MTPYCNQFSININEIARIRFSDFTNVENKEISSPVAEVVMHIVSLKALADFIYKTLEQHEQNTAESMKQAN